VALKGDGAPLFCQWRVHQIVTPNRPAGAPSFRKASGGTRIPPRAEAGRKPIPFPWGKLDGRPLVYASLGALVNGLGTLRPGTFALLTKNQSRLFM
jgi:hypothetical protein